MRLLLLPLALVLSSCANDSFTIPPDRVATPAGVVIRWQRFDQIEEVERACLEAVPAARARGQRVHACARQGWDELAGRASCTINTLHTVTLEVIGHELLHCYGIQLHRD